MLQTSNVAIHFCNWKWSSIKWTPMKTHIDVAHAHLLTKKKWKLINIVATKYFDINHNQQLGEKKGCIVWVRNHNIFFGLRNPYKHGDEKQQPFLEDLVLYICKGYKPLSTFENIWLQILVFHQCPYVNFPFHSNLVEHVLLEMV